MRLIDFLRDYGEAVEEAQAREKKQKAQRMTASRRHR